MSQGRDAEYTEHVAARLSSLRRLAAVLCDDWQRADDLVQAALVKLYVHWGRVRVASHADAYARAVLVREFIHERRSSWAKRVSLSGGVADTPAVAVDHDAALDLRAAVAALPPRQRATLVLRQFSPLVPYVSLGWLPAGDKVVEGGTSQGMMWLNTAPKLDSPRRGNSRSASTRPGSATSPPQGRVLTPLACHLPVRRHPRGPRS